MPDPFEKWATPPSDTGGDPFAKWASVTPEPSEEAADSSGAASTAVLAARGAPAAIRSVGRFGANHPAAVQKALGAGASAITAGIGGAVAGAPGAMVGALIRGITPTQGTIRTVAGRLAGEAKDVAKAAGRAVGIQEYIKSTSGLNVKPTDILERPHGIPAAEAYAKSQGRSILKILGPSGEVVAGPTAAPAAAVKSQPGRMSRAVGRAGRFPLGGFLQAATGVTDLAQALEPERRDIGTMGIGWTQPEPSADMVQERQDEMRARAEQEEARKAAMRASLLRMLGLR